MYSEENITKNEPSNFEENNIQEGIPSSKRRTFYQEWIHWNETHPLKPIPRLTYKLLRLLLKTGPYWILQLFRFLLFVILLMPAWYHLVMYYFMSREVRLNIRYGPNPRNYLDLFLPERVLSGRKCPVVIFITGGVWMIGYKAWGTPIGRLLAQFNIITVSVDYRNFPQGKMTDQLDDVDLAIDWTIRRIWKYGGDNQNIYLVGHSAGAHLSSYVYLSKILSDLQLDPAIHPPSPSPVKNPSFTSSHYYQPNITKWKSTQIKAFVGISGPYYIPSLVSNFHSQGLHRSLLAKIFSHSSLLSFYSPPCLLPENLKELVDTSNLPYRFYFMHGREDVSVPWSSSEDFSDKLNNLGFKSKMILYENRTHTSLVIEDLMNEKIEEAVVIRHLVHLIFDLSNYHTNTNWDQYFERHTIFDDVLDCRCHLLRGMKITQQISNENENENENESNIINESIEKTLFHSNDEQQQQNEQICHLHHLHYFPIRVQKKSLKNNEIESLKKSYQKEEEDDDDIIIAQNSYPRMISTPLLNLATKICPF